MIQAIFAAIAAVPKIASIIAAFASWVKEQVDEATKQRAEAELAKAVAKAKEHKDTSDIENVFNPKE
jgi:F0F1-type ATP synthase membrane subunit b/b'